MIVASYVMCCRGMSSVYALSDNFIPYDRFSTSLRRKFSFDYSHDK